MNEAEQLLDQTFKTICRASSTIVRMLVKRKLSVVTLKEVRSSLEQAAVGIDKLIKFIERK
jgi:hypothetical protein